MKSHVVLCAHNGAHFIAEQINSILRQDLAIDHVHVFDFNSSDGTTDVVRTLQAEVGNTVISLTCYADAPGASLSFFRAFEAVLPLLAADDYVYLSDQDDVWLPQKTRVIGPVVEAIIAAAPDRPVLVFHDVCVTDSALQTTSPTFYTGNPFRVPRDLSPDRLLLSNPAIGHTMVVSRSLLALVHDWASRDGYLMHDWCLVLFASRFGTIRFVPTALSLYRQHGGNILGAFRSRSFADRVRRTRGFATKVIEQARVFAADAKQLRAAVSPPPPHLAADRWLARQPLLNQLQLAGMALARGPTLERRGLALFLLIGRPRV